jgi:hypothetical protein
MKYTNYILGNRLINIEALKTDNPVLMLPMVIIGVPVALLGMATISAFLPAAVSMDEARKLKCFLIKFERKNKYQYGSKTHISNLFRNYISIPRGILMGSSRNVQRNLGRKIRERTNGIVRI